MSDRWKLRGQVAIVTGASSGIGRDTAVELVQAGVAVVIAARRADKLAALEVELRSLGGECLVCPVDVSGSDSGRLLVEMAIRKFGRIDILVGAAGQYIRGKAVGLTISEFEAALRVNFFGVLTLVYAALPHMLHQGSGCIVVVSSVDGKKGLPLDAPYVASKFAVTGFMDVLRQELHGTGLRAVTVLPGRVDTPMIKDLRVPMVSKKVPSRRVARKIVRLIERGVSAEVIVPFFGPKALVWMHALSPRAADWAVRLFKLQGVEQKA